MLENIHGYLIQISSHPVLKSFLSFIFLSIEYMVGGFDLVVRALLILLILDFLLGFAVAFRDHRISRKKMMAGLTKFIIYFAGMIMGYWVDIIFFHQAVEFGFKNAVIVYLGVNESLSIIHHMAEFGVQMPTKLINRLEYYRNNFEIK